MSKLTDKARGISFDDDDDAPTTPPEQVDRPRTAMGAISASIAMGRGVEAENRSLREKLERFEGASVVQLLDPARVKPSRYANRHELAFAASEFESLKAEIALSGRNVQPIKVRPLGRTGDSKIEYEIAFGHRRHRACLELGLPVAAIVEDLSDSQLFSEMDRENRERQDLSPWEQGVMYKRAIEEGLFPSIRKLAASVGAQVGNVSTAIQLASLPTEIIEAFPSPLNLQFRWGSALKVALDKDPEHVLKVAQQLAAASPKLGAKEVLSRLISSGATDRRDSRHPIAYKGKDIGYWNKDIKGNVSIEFKAGNLSPAQEKRLHDSVMKVFNRV